MIEILLLYVHLLTMIGAFGGLLMTWVALPRGLRDDIKISGPVTRTCTLLITVGLASGMALYWIKIKSADLSGDSISSHVHITLGLKFLLLLAAGGFLGISTKKLRAGEFVRAHTLRAAAALSLALAALVETIL